jgi:hypothetical protein
MSNDESDARADEEIVAEPELKSWDHHADLLLEIEELARQEKEINARRKEIAAQVAKEIEASDEGKKGFIRDEVTGNVLRVALVDGKEKRVEVDLDELKRFDVEAWARCTKRVIDAPKFREAVNKATINPQIIEVMKRRGYVRYKDVAPYFTFTNITPTDDDITEENTL